MRLNDEEIGGLLRAMPAESPDAGFWGRLEARLPAGSPVALWLPPAVWPAMAMAAVTVMAIALKTLVLSPDQAPLFFLLDDGGWLK